MGLACWFDLGFLQRDRSSRLGIRLINLHGKKRQIDRHAIFDRLIVGSQYMQRRLKTNGISEEQISIISPSVPLLGMEATRLPSEPRVLFVGQMVRGKGVHYLVNALECLKERGVDFEARLVGDGPWRDWIEKKVRNEGLHEQVEVLGYRKGMDLASQYAWTRVVAVPSIWPEPFGMVGLEAMHAGRPVVAFDSGGFRSGSKMEKPVCWSSVETIGSWHRHWNNSFSMTRLRKNWRRMPKTRVEERFGFDSYIEMLEAELAGMQIQPSEAAAGQRESEYDETSTEKIEV